MINVAAITIGVWRYSSRKSSNNIPITPAGTHAIKILIHIVQVSFFSTFDLAGENGFNFLKYNVTTAKIAPSWITTKNISLKVVLTFKLINSSTRIICPVLLIGSHSVIPSTIPKNITLIISITSIIIIILQSNHLVSKYY